MQVTEPTRISPGGPLEVSPTSAAERTHAPWSFREESRRLFDDCAPTYPAMDPFWGDASELISELEHMDAVPLAGNEMRMLDLGCGVGIHLIELARWALQHLPQLISVRALGLDFSPRMIERARARVANGKLTKQIRLLQRDILKWESPANEEYDTILCLNNTLGNLVGDAVGGSHRLREETLRKVRDTLAPTGVLMLSVFSRDYLETEVLPRSGYTKDRHIDPQWSSPENGDLVLWRHCSDGSDHCCFSHWFSPSELRSELRTAGLDIARLTCIGSRLLCIAKANHCGGG